MKLTQTSPLKEIVVERIYPAEVTTPEAYKAYAKSVFFQPWLIIDHQLNGVVDQGLKVYGTRNLRIADASILPLHITGHLQATVFTIGERAADIIKAACRP
ncbi:hypothetical protein AX16_009084 [Volvariella volvacea WC 439]|nr:hypothetical protein AX16_009084 [Volvariella volvacea WC 439]